MKLFKISSIHNNVRTSTIIGVTRDLPEIGKDFLMTGPGLEFGTRVLRTTPIMSVTRLDDTFLFRTRNSIYALLVVDEFDDEADNKISTTTQGGS